MQLERMERIVAAVEAAGIKTNELSFFWNPKNGKIFRVIGETSAGPIDYSPCGGRRPSIIKAGGGGSTEPLAGRRVVPDGEKPAARRRELSTREVVAVGSAAAVLAWLFVVVDPAAVAAAVAATVAARVAAKHTTRE